MNLVEPFTLSSMPPGLSTRTVASHHQTRITKEDKTREAFEAAMRRAGEEIAPNVLISRAYVPSAMVTVALHRAKWNPMKFLSQAWAENYLYGLISAYLKAYDQYEDREGRMRVHRRAVALIRFDLKNGLDELLDCLSQEIFEASNDYRMGWDDGVRWLTYGSATLEGLAGRLEEGRKD